MNQKQRLACNEILKNMAEFDKAHNRPQHLIKSPSGKMVPWFYNEGADRFEFMVQSVVGRAIEHYFMFIDQAGNVALAVYEVRNVLHLDGSRLSHDEYSKTYWGS